MSTTHLTDFIPAQVLEREGYIHTSDSEKMFASIDKDYLIQQGYVPLEYLREIKVSLNLATRIVRSRLSAEAISKGEKLPRQFSSSTLQSYAKDGYIKCSSDGKYDILDVLAFNYKKSKRKYLDSKGGANG